MRGLHPALDADTSWIVAFGADLSGYMALYHPVFWRPPLAVGRSRCWLMIEMIAGFLTASAADA